MSSRFHNLRNISGYVSEVQLHKAIIAFGYEGRQEQALLKKENLTFGGRHLRDECLSDVLPIGTSVKFWCRRIPEMKSEECAWFVTHAIKNDCQVLGDLVASGSMKLSAEYMPGLQRICGTISEVFARQGIITTGNGPGENHQIFFTASKLVLFDKIVGQNQKLPEVIQVGDPVFCDAIPMWLLENFKPCRWFATLVWKGRRPAVRNAPAMPKELGLEQLLAGGHNLQFMLYQVATDAKAMFVKTEARVMFLINSEFGVAMLLMKHNVLMSALFHKSVCYFFGHSLKKCDLRKFLREGDHIKFVGVEAPPGLISKFVATQIVICKPQ